MLRLFALVAATTTASAAAMVYWLPGLMQKKKV
jgi:hypothetical protein